MIARIVKYRQTITMIPTIISCMYTFYYVTLPKGENNENFNLAIELHADMMTDPVIPDYEMGAPFDVNDKNVTDKRERHVVIEEIRMRKDQPWTKVYNATNHAMYTNHPYKRDVIGTPEIISQVSQEEIMNYYRTFYSPKNVTTIIVGEFDFEEVLEKVKNEFNWGSRPTPPERDIQPDKPVQETVYIENEANINSSFMMFGYLGVPARDLKNLIALEMISIILGEGTSSRLYVNLIENIDENIFNMIDAENYSFRDGSNFFIQANFNSQYKEKAIELVKAEIPVAAFGGVYVVLTLIFMLLEFEKTKFEQAITAIFASVCVPYSFSLMIVFRDINEHIEGYTKIDGIYLLLFAFFAGWMTDIFAYFVGSKLGKHKLCPKISPKKSVEGAIGGVVGAILLNVLLLFVFKKFFFTEESGLSYIAVIFLSIILSVVSMFGDLAASTIKRNFGIKDFGKLLPGHGGIMDRFDSVLFVMPVLYSAIYFINAF